MDKNSDNYRKMKEVQALAKSEKLTMADACRKLGWATSSYYNAVHVAKYGYGHRGKPKQKPLAKSKPKSVRPKPKLHVLQAHTHTPRMFLLMGSKTEILEAMREMR